MLKMYTSRAYFLSSKEFKSYHHELDKPLTDPNRMTHNLIVVHVDLDHSVAHLFRRNDGGRDGVKALLVEYLVGNLISKIQSVLNDLKTKTLRQ